MTTPTMPACFDCGSEKSRRYRFTLYRQPDRAFCVNTSGCRARRCARRKSEDTKRGATKQCFATFGQQSILFCELREGHEGLHLHGTREWGGDHSHPIAQAFKALGDKR